MESDKITKKSFLLYCDQINVIDKLTDKQAGFLIKKVYGYCGNGHVPPEIEDPLVDVVFTSIRTAIDRDYNKYLKIVKRNKENGKKGGRPKSDPLRTYTGKVVPIDAGKQHFIYLIYDDFEDEYKIGETSNLIQRRYDIKRPTNSLNIYDFTIMGTRECQKLEKEIIVKYSNFRISGDWFNFSGKEADEISFLFSQKTQWVSNDPK